MRLAAPDTYESIARGTIDGSSSRSRASYPLNCYVVARYSGRPVSEVFHGTYPHFIAHLLIIAVMVALPDIILWLPNRMHGN